jgi:hypothetical protein
MPEVHYTVSSRKNQVLRGEIGGRMTTRRYPLILGFMAILFANPGMGQIRTVDQMFTDIDLLFDILTAVVQRIDIDDEAVLNQEFPGRTLGDFDRDRNGQFMTFTAALGLYDLNMAILQFNHDQVDADGDGVLGFYEIECRYAAGGIVMDPTLSETTEGTPDGQLDCDGDGAANLVEINAGTDPLDPTDTPDPDFEVIDPGVEIEPLTAGDGRWTITLEPALKHVAQGDGYTLEGQFTQ